MVTEGPVDRAIGAVDDLVPDADSAVAQMTAAEERAVTRAGIVFGICAVLMIPWMVYLAYDLPSRVQTNNYDIAWIGFDILLAGALLSVAWTAFRRSDWLPVAGACSATLLVTDAWFDVLTSTGRIETLSAIVMALIVELPLAGTSIWLSRHAAQVQRRDFRRRGRRT